MSSHSIDSSRTQRIASALMAAGVAFLLPLTPQLSHVGVAQEPQQETASEISRTPWGKPDLTGFYDYGTLTPLERPLELADSAFFANEDEAFAFFARREAGRGGSAAGDASTSQPPPSAPPGTEAATTGGPNAPGLIGAEWLDVGSDFFPNLQTSVVVDPPTGRIPPLTRPGQQMWEARGWWVRLVRQRVAFATPARGPEDYGLGERCILGLQSGPPFTSGVEGNFVQFFLAEEYFVIHTELNHEARVVPLDGRPHLSDHIRQWMGDSRGHWDGDTLVVETTNFSDKVGSWNDWFRSFGSGLTAHLVERFTQVDADTLHYEWTLTDLWTFTAPFSGSHYMKRDDGGTFEFHCHERNYSLSLMLSGTRSDER